MSLIDIGVSGLRVQQTALSVTGQNITNANTPGYSRQRVEAVPQNAGTDGSRFRGAGARVVDVERITDAFVTAQVRSDGSMRSELATLSEQIQSVDGLLFSETSGLDSAFDQFFSALNDANAVPDSLPERQLVLEAAENLANRFSGLNDQLNARSQGAAAELESATNQINDLAQSIAQLNRRIAELGDNGLSGAVNQLLDERDLALKSLSELVSVKVVTQDNSQANVFIGKGQALVLGSIAQQLTTDGEQDVFLRGDDGRVQPITQALRGGVIGGVLEFQSGVLSPAMQRLGQLAHTFVQAFNAEHARGIDLQGAPGGRFFADINAGSAPENRTRREDSLGGASGAISINIDDAKATRLSDYRLDFAENGNGAFSIRRLSDQSLVVQGRHTGLAQSLSFDGLTVTLGGADFRDGQSYRLMPLAQGAGDVNLALQAVEQIALASPARSSASISNQGSAELTVGAVLDPQHPLLQGEGDLTPPLLVRFVGEDRFDLLDNSDPTQPRALDPPIRSQLYLPQLSDTLALGTPGSTRLYSSAEAVGQLQSLQTVTTADATLGNGYQSQVLSFVDTGDSQAPGTTVQVPAGSSAAASAEMLNRVDGVSASAYTDLYISQLDRGVDGLGPNLYIGNEQIADVQDLEDLVTRVNENASLSENGIRATFEQGRVRITDINGEDIEIKLTGSAGAQARVQGGSGDALTLVASGVGDPAIISGTRDLRSGFDFSVGGPYSLTLTAGSQTAQVSLDQPYANADALVFDLQSRIDQALGSDLVRVGLDGLGQLRLTSEATGSQAQLLLAPNTAAADALGLQGTAAQGAERYAATSVGGQVALLLDPGKDLQVEGNGPFQTQLERFRGDLGFEFDLTGKPAVGDEFTIDFNANGRLDNRNGLVLAGLQEADLVGDPAATLTEHFAALVEFVGAKASQAATDQQAAEALLAQSEARLESISGVNLDEEAANLIRFEQGYNAAAQVISVARDVFNVLFNAVS